MKLKFLVFFLNITMVAIVARAEESLISEKPGNALSEIATLKVCRNKSEAIFAFSILWIRLQILRFWISMFLPFHIVLNRSYKFFVFYNFRLTMPQSQCAQVAFITASASTVIANRHIWRGCILHLKQDSKNRGEG